MATVYSSAYELAQGTTTKWVGKGVFSRVSGIFWGNYFRYVMPVGQTAADIIKLTSIFENVPVATPQIAGLRLSRLVLRCSGNAGGAITVNFGTVASPTLFGAALTTLQSANTLDVAIATLMAAGPFLTQDDIQLVLAGGPSTTLQTIDGFWQGYITTP